jgi:hypothetical protein
LIEDWGIGGLRIHCGLSIEDLALTEDFVFNG